MVAPTQQDQTRQPLLEEIQKPAPGSVLFTGPIGERAIRNHGRTIGGQNVPRAGDRLHQLLVADATRHHFDDGPAASISDIRAIHSRDRKERAANVLLATGTGPSLDL